MSPPDEATPHEPYRPRHAAHRLSRPAARRAMARLTPTRICVVVAVLAGVATLGGASASHATSSEPRRLHPELAAPAPTPADGQPQPYPLGLQPTPEPVAQIVPVGRKRLPPKPVHDAHPAPATTPVIAELAANGIPTVALNAYRLAAARMATALPSCGIEWSLLAAIGRVESNHGRFGGADLLADGTSTSRIIGIALDGTSSAYVADTDGGRLDGDRVFDHAVGPMQFIPGTWAAYQADGNADGVADPFNVNDAALAAARYLCAAGGDLRTRPGQIAAVLAYNDSDAYLAQVLALADAYARDVPVADVPITGPTSGDLPPTPPGVDRPINPAPPPAGAPSPGGPPGHAKPTPTKPRPTPSSSPPVAPTTPGANPTPTAPATTPTGSGATDTSTAPTPSTGAPESSPPNNQGVDPTSSAVPKPAQTLVDGVVCTIELLDILICPSPTG